MLKIKFTELIFILTPRLLCVYSHIKGKITADIGTDHAYIPIELIKNGISEHAFACDIGEGPCAIARANIEKEGLSDKIEVRTGAGLSVLHKNEADEIVIAGMGGKLITEIINENLDTAKASRLILQPMNSVDELRRFLIGNGFKITCEDLAEEGFKVYSILTAEKGTQKPYERNIDYYIPPSLYSHRHINRLLRKTNRTLSNILSGLKRSKTAQNDDIKTYTHLLSELCETEKIIKERN